MPNHGESNEAGKSIDMSGGASNRRLTADEFHRMAESGILEPGDRLELVAGRIVPMAPIGSLHAACVARLTRLLAALPDDVILWVQNPVRVDRHTEVVPDVTLLRARDDFYGASHPDPGDVLLLIEVADTTLDFDRRVKVPAYAAAGIPEAWLVNLPSRRIDVFRRPSVAAAGASRSASERAYAERLVARPGSVVEPMCVAGVSVAVGAVVG